MSEQQRVKIAGVWRTIARDWVKVSGTWRLVKQKWVKVAGVWKPAGAALKIIFVCEQDADRLYATDNDGSPQWFGSGTDSEDVACDSDGNSYWATDTDVIKLDVDGNEVWTFTGHANAVLSIAVDSDGYVYSGDIAGVVKRLNGNLPVTDPNFVEWTKTINATYNINTLAVDLSAGLLFAGTGFGADRIYRLITSNGNFAQISTTITGDVTAIAVDESGDLYFGENTGTVRKINISGGVQWTDTNAGSDIHGMQIGHGGFLYYAMGTTREVRKALASNGNEVWAFTPAAGTAASRWATVDQSGNVFGTWGTGGTSTENVLRKIDSSGNEVWTWQPYLNAKFFGVAVTPGIKAAGF